MIPQQLFNPERGQMRIAGMMSGTGRVLTAIIENERRLEAELGKGKAPYRVVAIFSDKETSNAREIGAKFDIPTHVENYRNFCNKLGGDWKDMALREKFDAQTVGILQPYNLDLVVLAGYMLKVTPTFINAFVGLNVHPADLSILDEKGKRKYRGDKAVQLAMDAGEKQIRSTIHIVRDEVDEGPLLLISSPWTLDYSLSPAQNQEKLKEVGDTVVFPLALENIAKGRFSLDEEGRVYFDGSLVENGFRL